MQPSFTARPVQLARADPRTGEEAQPASYSPAAVRSRRYVSLSSQNRLVFQTFYPAVPVRRVRQVGIQLSARSLARKECSSLGQTTIDDYGEE